MSLLPYLLLGFVILTVGLQLWAFWRAKRQQGRPAPDLSDLVPGSLAGGPRLVLYFFGERCGPCRAMAPWVDRLAEAYPNFIKVDVAERGDVARRFGIMGTPTFVLLEKGRISRVILGSTSERSLVDLLK